MVDHSRDPSVQAATRSENQAAAKKPDRGALEGLRELWGALAETPVGKATGFVYEQAGSIFDAAVQLFGEAVVSVRREADVAFWGKDTLPRQSEMHHSGNVDVAGDHQMSFDEIMAQRAEMMPPPDNVPQQEQANNTIDR